MTAVQPRYDASVLFEATCAPTVAELGRRLSIQPRQLYRYLRQGVTDQGADKLAVRLGCVPYVLWPEWSAGEGSESVVDVVEARRRRRDELAAAEAERRAMANQTITAAELPDRACEQCTGRFSPNHGRQRFCRMSCSEASRRPAQDAKSQCCSPSDQQGAERTISS
jgi:hypothetical protein